VATFLRHSIYNIIWWHTHTQAYAQSSSYYQLWCAPSMAWKSCEAFIISNGKQNTYSG